MIANDNNLNLPSEPADGLVTWLKEAEAAGLTEPTAMTLATATRDGKPSARIVLFKGFSSLADGRRCPRFFTNYESRKSKELIENPNAALVFHWGPQARQIRVEGRFEKVSQQESADYFASRPRGSQIGAWASPQSRKLPTREALDQLVKDTEEKFASGPIPCPPFWGGWRLVPTRFEFWQGVTSRLHDRFVYEWNGSGWNFSRLAP